MTVVDLFSKRKKRQASQGKADVYRYDAVPDRLRVQVVHIWRAALGPWVRGDTPFVRHSPSSSLWEFIQDTIARESGMWHLGGAMSNPETRCIEYLMSTETDGALDIIELSFRVIDRCTRDFGPGDRGDAGIKQNPDDAIEELNQRFQEHGVGYQYLDGEIVRVDSQFLHSETVKPALSLLHDAGFSGPADEFIRAFDHYRKQERKDAIPTRLARSKAR
jgi:AbiJ-like protein